MFCFDENRHTFWNGLHHNFIRFFFLFVASASMQVKGWKLPPRATSEMNVKFRTAGEEQEEDDKRVNPISLSKDRLLSVEVIERRYLKVPLGQSKGDLVQNVLSGSCLSNEPPKTLLTWREVVKHCETAAKCRCASASWKRLWLGTSRSRS